MSAVLNHRFLLLLGDCMGRGGGRGSEEEEEEEEDEEEEEEEEEESAITCFSFLSMSFSLTAAMHTS